MYHPDDQDRIAEYLQHREDARITLNDVLLALSASQNLEQLRQLGVNFSEKGRLRQT